MRIDVTKEDIAAGVPCAGGFCPVALAIMRITNGVVSVGFSYIVSPDWAILTPPKAAEFISAFDRRKPVEPFSFELEGI